MRGVRFDRERGWVARRTFGAWLEDSAVFLGCVVVVGAFAVASFLPVFV
jgi:hypothetical protein